MTESTEVEVEIPDNFSLPYYLPNNNREYAISCQLKMIDLLKEKLDKAKIPYFNLPVDRITIRIFYQTEEGKENYLYLRARRTTGNDGFYKLNILSVLKYYNESREVCSDLYSKNIDGTIDDYVSKLIKELTGLQVHPSEIDFLGTIIRKTPPMCYYEYFNDPTIMSIRDGLYYKIEANLN